jgi:cystathionine beta-lyase/cystathionine gamma-synthase
MLTNALMGNPNCSWSTWAVYPIKIPDFSKLRTRRKQGKDFFNYVSGRVTPTHKGAEQSLIYSRFNNPALEILEGRIAIWDGAEDCLVTGSGMSAIATTLLALSGPGDVVVYSEPVYGGTDTLINSILSQMDIQGVGFSGQDGIEGLQRAVTQAKQLGSGITGVARNARQPIKHHDRYFRVSKNL